MAADASSSSKGFAKSFSKKVFRTKEKVLQNLGKADKTTDDVFDEHVTELTKQQNSAAKLQKDLKNYVLCAKAMSAASKTFCETLQETYEPPWTGYDDLTSAVQQLAILWEDYLTKLTDDVQTPLGEYLDHFPTVRAKIAKRGRKLVDFDSARHNFQALTTAKKRDDVKILKAQDELDEARKVYDELNMELNAELPELFESRVNFMATNFHALFGAEAKFKQESGKLMDKLAIHTDQLASESKDCVFVAAPPPASPARPASESGKDQSSGDAKPKDRSSTGSAAAAAAAAAAPVENDVSASQPAEVNTVEEPVTIIVTNGNAAATEVAESAYEPVSVGAQIETSAAADEPPAPPQEEPPANDPPVATPSEQPSEDAPSQPVVVKTVEVLYQVLATHAYTGADSDELSFAVGDVIDVIKYDDPEEEQDEGWLMGMTPGGAKGVFPANFTKKQK